MYITVTAKNPMPMPRMKLVRGVFTSLPTNEIDSSAV